MAWTESKLQALRAKFSGDQGGQMYDPHFKEIASHIFGDGGYRAAPYAGMPTFLDAPAKDLSALTADELQVALVGVPMDLAVTNRKSMCRTRVKNRCRNIYSGSSKSITTHHVKPR